jgi:hypothetical protein
MWPDAWRPDGKEYRIVPDLDLPRPSWRPDKPLRGPPSDLRYLSLSPFHPSLRGVGASSRTTHSSTRSLSLAPPAGRRIEAMVPPRSGLSHSLPLPRPVSPPPPLIRSSARFLRLLFRISKGSGSPSSGARRSRTRMGRRPTAASRRGPPIWPSTSSSSSRSVCLTLPPFDRWNACMQVFSAGPVPLTPHRAFSVSGQTARAARPGDSRWEC